MMTCLCKGEIMVNEQLDLFFASVSEDDLQKIHDKKNKVRKLTPKEWELYRLIYHNSMVENRKTTQREICDKIEGFNWNNDIKAHDHCSAIWTAIKNNNESFEHEKIIISFNFEYWIGNEQETQVYLDNLWNDLEPRLMRYWRYLKKVRENGQGKLLDKNNNLIDFEKDNVRGFIESYGK